MNFRISPPCAGDRRGLQVEELVEDRDDAIARQRDRKAAVKPRRSDDQITAEIASPLPRRICPASTLGPVCGPR